MLTAFESAARQTPNRVCYACTEQSGETFTLTYEEARLAAGALVFRLDQLGVRKGDCIIVDLPNCALYPLIILAAAYGGFCLAPLPYNLSASEKLVRTLELQRQERIHVGYRIDQTNRQQIAGWLKRFQEGKVAIKRSESSTSAQLSSTLSQRVENGRQASAGRFSKAFANRVGFETSPGNSGPLYPNNARDTAIHYVERLASLSDRKATGLVIFTSGRTGTSKIVLLPWSSVTAAAHSFNRSMAIPEDAVWQIALSFGHINGLQAIIRSLTGGNEFHGFETFDPKTLFADVRENGADHLILGNNGLRHMVREKNPMFSRYECIVQCGRAINMSTARAALAANPQLYTGYGMAETSSIMAMAKVHANYGGELIPLDGYEFRIVDRDEDGFGYLSIKGPGLLSGYLNTKAAYTWDGFLLTTDTAGVFDGRLFPDYFLN